MELEAAAKRARASGGSSPMAGEPDRLSALPDCLLHTIMSFMKARQVVQTCVLSTRWKHLWRSVPCLDLDLDEFKGGEDSNSNNDEDKDWEHFEDFAVNLMIRRNIALLESLRLNAKRDRVHTPYFARERASTWIRRAMKYCAQDPVIQREGLRSDSWLLKRLDLCNISLDNRFAKHVTSACCSLEDLKLKDCFCEFHAITFHSLRNLILKNCEFNDLSDITLFTLKSLVIDGGSNITDEDCCPPVITTPALSYLHLDVKAHYFDASISFNEMPSLNRASIHLWGGRERITKSKLGCDQFELLAYLM